MAYLGSNSLLYLWQIIKNKFATKEDIASIYRYKGTVQTYSSLPSSGMAVGDAYNVETADAAHGVKAGDNVAWNGTGWDVLAGTVDLTNYVTTDAMNTALSSKVDKVNGKALSANDFTDSLKSKLEGIAANAEVNVQSDWNQSDSTADDFIKNKPTIPPAVTVDNALSGTSKNPVQNKVVKAALDLKMNSADFVEMTNAEIDAIVAE